MAASSLLSLWGLSRMTSAANTRWVAAADMAQVVLLLTQVSQYYLLLHYLSARLHRRHHSKLYLKQKQLYVHGTACSCCNPVLHACHLPCCELLAENFFLHIHKDGRIPDTPVGCAVYAYFMLHVASMVRVRPEDGLQGWLTTYFCTCARQKPG